MSKDWAKKLKALKRVGDDYCNKKRRVIAVGMRGGGHSWRVRMVDGVKMLELKRGNQ